MFWVEKLRRKAVVKKSHKNLSKFSHLLGLYNFDRTDGNYSIIF